MTVQDSADLLIERRDDRRWDRRARASRGASSSTGSGCGSWTRASRSPANVGRRIDATGRVVAPGFIDLHSHGGLMILAEPRHEPKVRQGITTEIVGVDGNSFAPFPGSEDLEAFVELDSGLDGRPPIDYDWDSVGRYLERFDGTVSVNVGTLVGNSALRIAALGWDDVPADAPGDGPDARDAPRLARPGRRRALVGARLPAGLVRDDRGAGRAHGRGRAGRRLLPQPRALPARRPLPRPVPRGDRDRASGRRARPHHPLLPSRDASGARRAAARSWSTMRGRPGSTSRSTRIPRSGPAPACSSRCRRWIQAGGPGPLKARLAERGARDRLRAEIAARGAAYTGRAGWADLRLGAFTHPDNLRWESRTLAEVMDETGRDAVDAMCDLLLSERPGREPGHERAVVEDAAAVRRPSGRDGRHGLDVPRREAGAADVRLVPADPGPVRARRGAALARGGDPQDDVGARPRGSGCDSGACCATG